jgi:hypothetical protein
VTISTPSLLFNRETGVKHDLNNWKSTYLNELNVRKPLEVSISQRSEEMRLNNVV